MEIEPIGTFRTFWGESLVWDERRQRLYFADCMASTIHWLDVGQTEPTTYTPPSLPTGIVPTDTNELVVVQDDGLHLVDPDAGTARLIAAYPDELEGRCNDACADLDGNIITGKLNIERAPGSAWRWSPTDGWAMLDDDIANTNGPQVIPPGNAFNAETLVVGDTSAHYFAYPYDSATGDRGERRVVGDVAGLDGAPDGSAVDADGGLWCALVGGGQIARFTDAGLDRTVPVPAINCTDLTFGGPDLETLYVVSIGGEDELDGALLAITGLGVTGRCEPRARVA